MPLDGIFFPRHPGLLHSCVLGRRAIFGWNSSISLQLISFVECQGGDSNPYGFLHQILSLARIPISPPRQIAILRTSLYWPPRANCTCKLPQFPATNRRMVAQDLTRPVFVPVIIGTPRQGRLTEPAANFVFGEVSKRSDIQTELIDIRKIPLRIDDAGEALKDTEFSA